MLVYKDYKCDWHLLEFHSAQLVQPYVATPGQPLKFVVTDDTARL